MAIFDLFSKRQKILRGEIPDVYTYNKIPDKLKVQIVHIIQDGIGSDSYHPGKAYELYKLIHDVLCREYGLFTLCEKISKDNYEEQALNYFLCTNNMEEMLDVIEITFRIISKINNIFPDYYYTVNTKASPEDAINELNERFKEHGLGYSFEEGKIIRIDSTYIHSEVVKPTISLLQNKKFKGANEEYLKAHDHYQKGNNKECLNDCLKAFESTMKVICSEKKWQYNQGDTAKKLIQICFDNNLIPQFSQNQFTSLRSLLESGIPTIRNRLGGHGQGQIPQKVDNEMARYALNLTGSNIIFLIEQSGIN